MRWTWLAVAMLGVSVAGCGTTASGGGGASCTPGTAAAIALSAAGASPTNACVLPSGTVTFTNNDTAAHDVEFGAAGCPSGLGPIAPSGGHVTGTFAAQGSCAYHDADNPANTAFQGTVFVTTAPVSGGGY